MSKLIDWIKQSLYEQHGAATGLTELYQAFSATLIAYERRQWPRGVVVQALTEAGYTLEDRGRRDQPKRMVLGLTFDAPRVHRDLSAKINEFLRRHLTYRFTEAYEGADDAWLLTVTERPDYSPAQYRISYTELAERLTASGIQCDAQIVRAALRNWAKVVSTLYTGEQGWDHEECEEEWNRSVRSLGPDGLIGFRWREDGDGKDYFGQYVPAAGQTSRVMRVSLDRKGEREFAACA